ncbi:MAG TPA: GNAT family N-acetyltransferase [Steroidobacteraceae bacterium]|nr:GNAT family N-acetyltransferase [Steroidobacteraceae bacterium]
MNDPAGITVEPASPRLPEARELIAQLDTYLNSLYPPERNYLLDIESLCSAEVTFFLARCDGAAAGCGAVRRLDASTAEVKRMYVRPQFRGRGIGLAILQALEARVRQIGLRRLLLETGSGQPEALALYERQGYQRRAPYGEYRDEPSSVFMEKLM